MNPWDPFGPLWLQSAIAAPLDMQGTFSPPPAAPALTPLELGQLWLSNLPAAGTFYQALSGSFPLAQQGGSASSFSPTTSPSSLLAAVADALARSPGLASAPATTPSSLLRGPAATTPDRSELIWIGAPISDRNPVPKGLLDMDSPRSEIGGTAAAPKGRSASPMPGLLSSIFGSSETARRPDQSQSLLTASGSTPTTWPKQPWGFPLPPDVWEPWRQQTEQGIKGLIDWYRRVFKGSGGGGDKDPDCEEEIRAAREACIEAYANGWKGDFGAGPYRKRSGGPWTIQDCMRGRISERCGGNKIDK
jgi:hypothetical protein